MSAKRAGCFVTALRCLAQRRLTEAQLWTKLQRKGYPEDEVRATIERCRADGYLDDRLFAQLYVEGKQKAVGDVRLVGELVRKGIDRDAAYRAVQGGSVDQHARLDNAIEKLYRTKPGVTYPSAARALERLGFPASLIYRRLRERAADSGVYAGFGEGEL